PPDATAALISKLLDLPVELLTADKPWFPSLASAHAARELLSRSHTVFRGFDHYVALSPVRWVREEGLERLLQGLPRSISAELHEVARPSSPAQEIGVLADLLIHVVSVCRALLPQARLQVTEAVAGRHVDSPFATESYARVTMRASHPGTERFTTIDLS